LCGIDNAVVCIQQIQRLGIGAFLNDNRAPPDIPKTNKPVAGTFAGER